MRASFWDRGGRPAGTSDGEGSKVIVRTRTSVRTRRLRTSERLVVDEAASFVDDPEAVDAHLSH